MQRLRLRLHNARACTAFRRGCPPLRLRVFFSDDKNTLGLTQCIFLLLIFLAHSSNYNLRN
jgi:hypothetical protein